MMDFKYVYFDVGGVLLLDFSKTNKWELMKLDMGISRDDFEKFDAIWEKHAKRVCLDYDVDQLIPVLKKELNLEFQDNYSLLVDFVDRFNLNTSLLPIVEGLRDISGIGLITDMYPRMLDLIRQKRLIPNVSWDVILDSSVIGHQKPSDEVFKLAEEKANVDPEQILFVDNLEKNVEAARNRGWKTFLYDPAEPEKSSAILQEMLGLS